MKKFFINKLCVSSKMMIFFSILLLTFMMLLNSVQSSETPRRRNRPERPAIVNYDPLNPYNVVVDGVTHRLRPGPHHAESSETPRRRIRSERPAIVNYDILNPYNVMVDGMTHQLGPGTHQAGSSYQTPHHDAVAPPTETLLVYYRPDYPYDVVVNGMHFQIQRVPGRANLQNGALVFRDGNPLGIIFDEKCYNRDLYQNYNIIQEWKPAPNDLVIFGGAPVAKFDNDRFRPYIIVQQGK